MRSFNEQAALRRDCIALQALSDDYSAGHITKLIVGSMKTIFTFVSARKKKIYCQLGRGWVYKPRRGAAHPTGIKDTAVACGPRGCKRKISRTRILKDLEKLRNKE